MYVKEPVTVTVINMNESNGTNYEMKKKRKQKRNFIKASISSACLIQSEFAILWKWKSSKWSETFVRREEILTI